MAQHKNRRLPAHGSFRPVAQALTLLIIFIAQTGSVAFARATEQAGTERAQVTTEIGRAIEDKSDLLPGAIIEREIAAGKRHLYQIRLSDGQFVRAVFEGLHARFQLALLTPSHRRILGLNSRYFLPTLISFISDFSGAYTLEVRSLEEDENQAHYKLTLEQVREPAEQDRNLIAAERAFAEAEKLRAEWDAKSLLRSVNKYKEACAYWHSINDRKKEADALKNIGEVYSILSQNQKALDCFNEALPLSRDAGDRQLEIGILNNIIETYIEFGKWQSALDSCKHALSLSEEAGFIQGQAQALNNAGLIYHLLSDFQNALDSFNHALKLWREAGDRRGEAQTLTNIGYSHSDLGNLQKSLSFLNEALTLWRRSKDLKGEAQTLTAIALLNSSQGETQKSLENHTRAIRLFQKMGDPVGEAMTLNAMAYIYDTLGDKQKALNLYNKALGFYQTAGRLSSEAITIGLIGEMHYGLGDKKKALDYYKQKLDISRALKDHRAEAYALKDMGLVFDSLGEIDNALDCFNRALSLSQTVSDPRAQAYALNSIGYTYERSGQAKKASDYYKQAILLNRATEDRAAEAQTLRNIARVARDLGDLKEAYEQSKALLNIVETFRAKVASPELRASYFASAHQHYELHIDILMRLHNQYPAAGYDVAALEASERSRGRVLLDLLNEARADIRQGVEASLLERERDLRQMLNRKAERQIRLLSEAHSQQQAAAIKKEVADLTTQHEESLAEIRANSRKYASLTEPRTLRLSEIQQELLDQDTLLLEYSLGDERSYLWAVTSTSANAYELPARSKIEAAAIRLYSSLTSYGEHLSIASPRQKRRALEYANSEYSRAAVELTGMLLEPVAAHLATKRLVIVADGALQYLPFAALPHPDPKGQDKREPRPLIAEHEIINLPSASIFSALRSDMGKGAPAQKALAVFADPVFEKDDSRLIPEGRADRKAASRLAGKQTEHQSRSDEPLAGTKERLRFARLPFSSSEARAIAALVPEQERKLALGFDASLSTAKSAELQQYRVIHFATHGLIYGPHPQLYGVALSLVDKQGNQQDGFLRLNEVYNLKLGADMVVLSACQTALGKQIKGEGLVGLARGFMHAGARRVVASLWKVDDRASAELMKYFYEEMFGQQKLRPAAALQAAIERMRKQRRFSSPYFWAAFVLQGEWK